MDQATHNKILSFIWGIADDVLRDLFKRGKYPDVILPMCVIRRVDSVLEPTKEKVLGTKKMLDEAGITEQRAALCDAAGQSFYNTSKFTLRDLKSRSSQQQLFADFEDYLNGFSPNVQDIILTLSEFCQRRFAPWAESTCSLKTWRDFYRVGLLAISRYKPLAELRLDAVTSERVAEFAAHRQSLGREISTLNASLRIIRRILRAATDWGELEKTPRSRCSQGKIIAKEW